MPPRRSNKLSKASKTSSKKSPKPEVEEIQRRLRDERVRTWLNQVDPDDHVCVVEEDGGVVSTCDGKYDASKCREVVEITDDGLDEWDEDGGSGCSIASGPSFFHHNTSRTSRLLCSACHKLYKKAKRTKAPVKNKLQDNDPRSLTCDQWVLIKKRMPRKLLNPKRRRLRLVNLNKGRKNHGATSTCSRPHTFLQRNLRRCTTVPAKNKRKNMRKRARKDAQESRVAKQQRLQSNSHYTFISTSNLDDSPDSFFSSWECKSGADAAQTADAIPSSVTVETAKQKQELPKKKSGFRDLLSQLRGNMIVREKR